MTKIELTREWSAEQNSGAFFHIIKADSTAVEISFDLGRQVDLVIAAEDVITIPPTTTYVMRSAQKTASVEVSTVAATDSEIAEAVTTLTQPYPNRAAAVAAWAIKPSAITSVEFYAPNGDVCQVVQSVGDELPGFNDAKPSGEVSIWHYGAQGDGVDDSSAFEAVVASKPTKLRIPAGNFRIDPIVINWRCHITIEPGATIEQMATGVSGVYTAPDFVVTRQALFSFVTGSEYSVCEGGGWFDGRRHEITGFISEYRTKWGAIDVFASHVTVRNLHAKRFFTFPFSNEGDYSSMTEIFVEDSGQGAFCGVFRVSDTKRDGFPFDGRVGQTFKNITVSGIDNNGASGIFQHAIDVMFSHESDIENLKIVNQAGDSSGSSTYASGGTFLGCVGSRFSGLFHSGFSTALGHLAFSMVGNVNTVFTCINIKGIGLNSVGSIGIEDISNEECVFSNYVINMGYFTSSADAVGVNYNVGAQYSIFNRNRRRSLYSSRSTHIAGRVIGGHVSYYLRGSKPKIIGCTAVGPVKYGAIVDEWSGTNSYGTPDRPQAENCEIYGMTVVNPGLSGISTRKFFDLSIKNCKVFNAGQSLSVSDVDRSGINASAVSASGRLSMFGNETIDDQGDTVANGVTFAPASSDESNRATITILSPNKFDYNQHFRIINGGGTGVDVDAYVVDIIYDDFVIQASAPFSLSAAGNTAALSGSWTTDATDPTKLNGIGGDAITEITGSLWVTDGSEWRQISNISGDNTLFINEAFTTALSSDSLDYLAVSVTRGPQGSKSMQNGIRVTPAMFDSVSMRDNISSGSTVRNCRVAYSVASDLESFSHGSEYSVETENVSLIGSSGVNLTQLVPFGHSITGAATEVVEEISGGGFTSFSLVVASAAGSTIETVASSVSGALGTKVSRAVQAQSRNDTVERRLRAVAAGGTPTAGAVRAKMTVKVDKPDTY